MNIKKLNEKLERILNERGGSDYGSFYKKFNDELESNKELQKSILQFFSIDISLSDVNRAILNLQTENENINKKQNKILNATLNMTESITDDGLYGVFSKLENKGINITDFIDNSIIEGGYYGDDLQDLVAFIENDLLEFIEETKQGFSSLIKIIENLNDGGFKSNKQILISEFTKGYNNSVIIAQKIIKLFKQEWPNGFRNVLHYLSVDVYDENDEMIDGNLFDASQRKEAEEFYKTHTPKIEGAKTVKLVSYTTEGDDGDVENYKVLKSRNI